jgi:hypothetical protein
MDYPAPAVDTEDGPTEPEDVALRAGQYSAVRLFLQAARQARSDFEATDDDL